MIVFLAFLGRNDALQWVEIGPELEVVVCGSDSGCELLIFSPLSTALHTTHDPRGH